MKISGWPVWMFIVALAGAAMPAFSGGVADDIFTLIQSRRSVRDYLPTPVPKEHILKILDAARMAPTSGNQQPWKFLVVQDRDKLNLLLEEQVRFRVQAGSRDKKLSETELAALREKSRASSLRYLSAPVFIVILTDSQSTYPGYNHWDGPLAAGYLMLAARSLGYGTVFITDGLDFGVIRKALAIPDRYEIVCATPLGIPRQWPETPPKKPLDSFIVFEAFDK